MRTQPRHSIRYGLALLTALVAVGCKDDGVTDPGSIALSLNPTSASVAQGGNTTTTATLTRSGGFTGSVTLNVTGAPAGVTAAVSNIQTTGTVTTATVTVTVGAAVATGTYPLVVRGTGSGVDEATATFSLTVTAAPAGSYTLSLSSAALSIAQGASTPTTTVNVNRTNFTGNVQLAVTGLPAGVTAAFAPNPATGASSVLTLTVGAAVAAQAYNLTVTGTASVGNQSTPLTLTVTAPQAGSYTLSLTSAALSIAQGASTPTTTVNVNRTNFAGDVQLAVTGLPAGVTAAFAPNPATGNSSVLTLTVGAAVAAQVYNLSVTGTASVGNQSTPLTLTVTAPQGGSYTLSLSSAALSIAQGASTPTTTVNVNRTNFSGDVQLAVTGLPAGVTAAFVPNPATGASSVLTLTVGAAVPAQVYNLTVTGTASVGNQSTPLALTVTAAVAGNFTLTTTPATSASVVQGASTNVTVNLARTGGFAGGVNLTATGLPAGLTATFNPTSPTGATSTLTLAATAGLAVGAYPIVIRGNFTGLAEQTVNLTVNVTPSGGGSGNVTLSFAACAVADRAVWVAFQDGTAGAWTRVTGTNDVYQFNITSGKGGVAWVELGTGTSTINVQYFSQAEMTAGVLNFCGAALTGKTVNATVANLPGGAQGRVSFGGGFAAAVANGPVQLTNVLDGSQDLVAYAGQLLGPGATDRVFLARGLNPANGGSLGTVDFTGTGSFAVTPGTITLAGGAGGEVYSQSMFYLTGPSCVISVLYPIGTFSASPFTAYGIGSANQAATDLHRLTVIAIQGTTDFRTVVEDFKNIGNRTLTLPSALGAVTASNAGGPYKRPMLVTTFPAELNSSAVMTFSDQTVAGKDGAIIASAAWLGGLNVSLTLPDFSALSGWSNAWAPATGDQVNWTLSGSGTNLTSGCQEGGRLVSSTKTGTI